MDGAGCFLSPSEGLLHFRNRCYLDREQPQRGGMFIERVVFPHNLSPSGVTQIGVFRLEQGW